VHKLLADQDVTVDRNYVGEYATSLEMAGASPSLCSRSTTSDSRCSTRRPNPVLQGGITTINGNELSIAIRNSLGELTTYSEELGDLDQALGDGDLGITVSLGSAAAIDALFARTSPRRRSSTNNLL